MEIVTKHAKVRVPQLEQLILQSQGQHGLPRGQGKDGVWRGVPAPRGAQRESVWEHLKTAQDLEMYGIIVILRYKRSVITPF